MWLEKHKCSVRIPPQDQVRASRQQLFAKLTAQGGMKPGCAQGGMKPGICHFLAADLEEAAHLPSDSISSVKWEQYSGPDSSGILCFKGIINVKL